MVNAAEAAPVCGFTMLPLTTIEPTAPSFQVTKQFVVVAQAMSGVY